MSGRATYSTPTSKHARRPGRPGRPGRRLDMLRTTEHDMKTSGQTGHGRPNGSSLEPGEGALKDQGAAAKPAGSVWWNIGPKIDPFIEEHFQRRPQHPQRTQTFKKRKPVPFGIQSYRTSGTVMCSTLLCRWEGPVVPSEEVRPSEKLRLDPKRESNFFHHSSGLSRGAFHLHVAQETGSVERCASLGRPASSFEWRRKRGIQATMSGVPMVPGND